MKTAALAALILWPLAVSAHDVPDDVRIAAFLKPEGNRMTILVRIPANALIDILFPMIPGSNWLDLGRIDGFATEGARVWVADLLNLYEGDQLLPEPRVLVARISRLPDSSFRTFPEALEHVTRDHLPPDTLLLQDQASLDVLLETPIQSAYSSFSFKPRFARVGVRVITSLVFLPAAGGTRAFEYEGDPETFKLDPTWSQAAARFIPAGFQHYWVETDYWLFLLCVGLVFRRYRALIPFTVAFAAAQSCALIGTAFGLGPSSAWTESLWGVLIAAAIVYMGIEAIVCASDQHQRPVFAIISGLLFGSGFWFVLQPLIQFGGVHRLGSVVSFDIGVQLSQACVLALLVPALNFLLRLSSAPRVITIIVAAIAIRVSWHRMLDRAQTVNLWAVSMPVINPMMLAIAGIAVTAIVAIAIYRSRARLA